MNCRNVLGGVPMTAADSAVKAVVDRLDFDSYKELIRGLTQFGDREQGTPRNAAGHRLDRGAAQELGVHDRADPLYVRRLQRRSPSREQVYATKIGAAVPGEMYILGGHMDGIGGGEAANDDGSGTALVMEIARVLCVGRRRRRRGRSALPCGTTRRPDSTGARAYVDQRARAPRRSRIPPDRADTPSRSGWA